MAERTTLLLRLAMVWHPRRLPGHAGGDRAHPDGRIRAGVSEQPERKGRVLCLLAGSLAGHRILRTRTLLTGWLCLVAELFILLRYKQDKDLTWFLPPLFI